jgi:hypothetical protein
MSIGNVMGDVMTFWNVNRERDGGLDDILEIQYGNVMTLMEYLAALRERWSRAA